MNATNQQVAGKHNPFASAAIERVPFRFSSGAWYSQLKRLDTLRYHATITGPKGTGKTTLLAQLHERLQGTHPVHRARTPRTWPIGPADIAAVLLAVGLLVAGMWIVHGGLDRLGSPAGLATGLGQITALIGTYLALAQVVLMARVPWIDHVVGSDKLMVWHRALGIGTITLILSHVVLTTTGFSRDSSWILRHSRSEARGSPPGVSSRSTTPRTSSSRPIRSSSEPSCSLAMPREPCPRWIIPRDTT